MPDVNGHSCARLRSRVVLPLPEPPVITNDSPGSSRTSSGSTSRTPAGVRTSTSSSSTEPSALGSAVNDGSSLACFVGGDQPVEADDGRAIAGERVVDVSEERQRVVQPVQNALRRLSDVADWI